MSRAGKNSDGLCALAELRSLCWPYSLDVYGASTWYVAHYLLIVAVTKIMHGDICGLISTIHNSFAKLKFLFIYLLHFHYINDWPSKFPSYVKYN